jgi:hypothetical protein
MTSRPNRLIPALVLSLALVGAAPLSIVDRAHAQPEGVSYTFTPTYNVVQWSDEIGLDDTELYGGRLGISFGRMVSLQGFYLTRDDVRTRLATLDPPLVGEDVADRKLDVSNYGVDVTLNLGAGRVVPFLRGGGGVLSFNPAQGDAIRQIAMKAGGGMRFGFRRFQAEVFAEDSAFRIDRLQLVEPPAGWGFPPDRDADRIRHNLSMGAGLTFFLGGTRESRLSETDRALLDRYRQGLSGLSIPVEPFAGRLDFHEDLALDNQYLIGLRTGFDFGRLFGLRGYYWRGVNDDFDKTVPIQSWGGEARFNLNSGQGAVPYIVTGVGQLDFMDDFCQACGPAPDDKTMLILGGGLGFRLSDRFEMDISARDHILSANDLDDTSRPDDLLSNWMFGASVRFSLGGGSAQGQRPLFGKTDDASTDAVRMDVETDVDKAPEPAREEQIEKVILEAPAQGSAVGYASERMIMFPVPTEGEIYIRYGTPGGVSIESRSVTGESAAPDTLTSAAAPPSMTPPVPPASAAAPDLDAIRRIIRDELRRAGVIRESGEAAPEVQWIEKDGTSAPRRIVFEEPASSSADEADVESAEDDGDGQAGAGDKEPTSYRVYTGLGLDDPTEFVIGARVNLGPISGNSPFRFVPEVALGLGSDLTTYLLAGNLQLPLLNLGGSHQWSPYASAGLGLLKVEGGGESDTDLTVNFAVGLDARFGAWAPFLEYQGVRGFDVNRLLVGIRFR